VTALRAAGCERIYREKASGGRWDRPELHRLLDQLRKGDVLVVWKLDRLSRSLRDVLTVMERRAEAKAGFRSLTEAIDTTTPAGRMMMQMVGSFAEFERASCGSARRLVWRRPAEKGVLADVRRN
jgi:DNA invertase Pin-like site-specific DNA recombinase